VQIQKTPPDARRDCEDFNCRFRVAMPISALGAAAVAGGLQTVWSYNRENYMFDIPLRQARQYQVQNMQLARFQLFREDVRDMAAVTVDKVQSYMIVNTLKLGFIITVFFNFDRTDTEGDLMGHEENQVAMIFSVTMATSFFWLITSIWFSMHAVILSQTLMTKMLLQVARIPLPSLFQIADAAPNSSAFERNFIDAFRVPFLQGTPWGGDDAVRDQGRKQNRSTSAGPCGPTESERSTTPLRTSTQSENTIGAMRGWLGSPRRREREEDMTSQPSMLSPAAGGDTAQEKRTVSITELLQGAVQECDVIGEIATSVEPHMKLFKLLRISWAPYDLYARIAMELGTACLLSGLAYFAIYYLRDVDGAFHVQEPAWVTFVTLSVLAWWSSILDMTMPVWGHLVLAVMMLGGPVSVFINYAMMSELTQPERHWALFRAFAFQMTWVVALCWSAFGIDGKWPRLWRASLFLNVLHAEDGPKPFKKDTSSSKLLGPKHTKSTYDDVESEVSSDSDIASVVSADDLWNSDGQEYWRAQLAAGPLLRCLDAAMCTRKLKHGPIRRKVRLVRDKLYESCRASGALNLETCTSLPVEGFWLRLEGADRRYTLHWVSPSGLEAEPSQYDCGVEVTLPEIMKAADSVSALLHEQSYKWTEEDMRRLEAYGGEALPGLRSFIAQFRNSGSDTTCGLGSEGTHIFRGGVLLMTLLWVVSCSWMWTETWEHTLTEHKNTTATEPASGPSMDIRRLSSAALVGSRLAFRAPPWLAAKSIGCDALAERIALTDEVGVFVLNRTGGGRFGPLSACDSGAAPVAASFDASGRAWAACGDGLQQLLLRGDELVVPRRVQLRSASLGVAGLHALALDSSPTMQGDDRLDGVALRDGRLLALQFDNERGWALAGSVSAPNGRRFNAVALRGGRGVALDSNGAVFEFESATGRWEGPMPLPPNGLTWRGVCVLPGSEGWFVAGQPPADRGGSMEFWRFPWHESEEWLA